MSQPSTYYLWKWGDNNLPGKPNEVFSDLLRGQLHPALQTFDARPVLQDLQTTAEKRHALGEEWNWQVQAFDDVTQARFVFLQCPVVPLYGEFRHIFNKIVFPHDLSGYDEPRGNLIQCLLPKLNSITFGETPGEELCDIVADDLPVLLSRLSPEQEFPWARLGDRASNYVQCYAYHNGFSVEWLENHSLTDDTDYDLWRAGKLQSQPVEHQSRFRSELRIIESKLRHVTIQEFQCEKLRFGDVLHIFQVFLRRESKPDQYRWRNLRQEFEQAKQQLRASLNE